MKFIYKRSTCSLSVLNNGLKLELLPLKQLVYILLTYSFSVLNMASKHFALQVMKFV